jgi:hypothetical protein
VRSVRPRLLNRLHANDSAPAAELLQDPAFRRRNRIGLDGTLCGDFTFTLKR